MSAGLLSDNSGPNSLQTYTTLTRKKNATIVSKATAMPKDIVAM
jgi:hypothetical protein